jgi:hypothetical protein
MRNPPERFGMGVSWFFNQYLGLISKNSLFQGFYLKLQVARDIIFIFHYDSRTGAYAMGSRSLSQRHCACKDL